MVHNLTESRETKREIISQLVNLLVAILLMKSSQLDNVSLAEFKDFAKIGTDIIKRCSFDKT